MIESKIIKVPPGTSIVCVGDIHEHRNQFNQMYHYYNFNDKVWLVSVGDVYDKGGGEKEAEYITDKLIKLSNEGCAHAVKGNHELKIIKKAKTMTPQLRWWRDRPLALVFQFYTGKRITVVHAGVEPSHTFEILGSRVDVCYIRELDENGKMIPLLWTNDSDGNKVLKRAKEGKPWHELYDGRFGYIVSGHHAQKDGVAKYYPFSCNIDSGVFDTGKLTTQAFDFKGELSDSKVFTGPAYKPNLSNIVD